MNTLRNLLNMIKFPHTVFALPFALMGAVLAGKRIPDPDQLLWILLAMVSARTAAMTLNRIVDRDLDAVNPRTAQREIPKGIVTTGQAAAMLAVSVILFEWAAFSLNRLCLILSPVALFIILGYSFTKRFTRYSHLVLGLSLSMAPLGAWIAVRGSVDLRIIILSLAVLFWVAGFDILYAIQDMDFDRQAGLYSIPRFFGVRTSLLIARIFHSLTFMILLLISFLLGLGVYYLIGVLTVGGLLFYEHSLVSEHDLSRLNMAFFNMNGYISVTIFAFTLLDILM
ncbi:MAG: UbiA-like polyprenyltransferase [bacterium]